METLQPVMKAMLVQTPSAIYNTEQAAQVLSIHERTLLDKLRSGEIKASKAGGRWYVLHSSLVEWIERNSVVKPKPKKSQKDSL
jgi:excisionase family DNA binding protein